MWKINLTSWLDSSTVDMISVWHQVCLYSTTRWRKMSIWNFYSQIWPYYMAHIIFRTINFKVDHFNLFWYRKSLISSWKQKLYVNTKNVFVVHGMYLQSMDPCIPIKKRTELAVRGSLLPNLKIRTDSVVRGSLYLNLKIRANLADHGSLPSI